MKFNSLEDFIIYLSNQDKYEEFTAGDILETLQSIPAAEPTLHGYTVKELVTIAEILRKENMPPEMIREVLSDIGRIIYIAINEFEEMLRKSVDDAKRD